MSTDFENELVALGQPSVPALRARYRDVFGEATRSGNKVWLVRRIAWRVQAAAYGGLSERARRRAEELARDADVRLQPPRQAVATSAAPIPNRAPRLLRPGTTIRRKYKGKPLEVLVVPTGFAFEGEIYASLSAVAKTITGGHCNGRAFFKLSRKGSPDEQAPSTSPCPAGSLRHLYAQVDGGRSRQGLQLPGRPTGGSRGFH